MGIVISMRQWFRNRRNRDVVVFGDSAALFGVLTNDRLGLPEIALAGLEPAVADRVFDFLRARDDVAHTALPDGIQSTASGPRFRLHAQEEPGSFRIELDARSLRSTGDAIDVELLMRQLATISGTRIVLLPEGSYLDDRRWRPITSCDPPTPPTPSPL